MATIIERFRPEGAQFLTTAFPQFVREGTNFPVTGLSFDADTDQAAFWKFKAKYGSGNLTYDIEWYAATATTGTIVFEVQLAAITPNTDSQDVSTKALATLNFVQDTHLGTTAKRLHTCTITQTNLDSIALNDAGWFRFARDANGTNATDNMAGAGIVTMITLSYSDT